MKMCILMTPLLFYMGLAFSGSDNDQVYGNTVSIGKIVINGKEIANTDDIVNGSGKKNTLRRKLKAFSAVTIDGAFDLIYKEGPPSISITGDDNLISLVKANVRNKRLRLSIEKSYRSHNPIVINISSANLQAISAEGSSSVRLDDIDTEHLLLNLSGAVDLVATGKATKLILHIKGSGDVKAKGLMSDEVIVDLSGTGDVVITAHESLQANLSGAGDISYFGSPRRISKNQSGVGDVEAAE